MAEPAPVQPLPVWMTTTLLQVGPSNSAIVTIQFPQTYTGENTAGITWPWVLPGNPDDGTLVSVVGGADNLTRIGGTGTASPSASPPAATAAGDASSARSTAGRLASGTIQTALSTGSSVTPSPASRSSSALSSLLASSVAISNPMASSSRLPSTGSSPTMSDPTPSASSTSPAATGESSPSTILSSATSAVPSTLTSASPIGDPGSASPHLSSGVIAAIIVSVIAVLTGLLLLVLAYFLRRRRARRRFGQLPETPSEDGDEEYHGPNAPVWARGVPFASVAAAGGARGRGSDNPLQTAQGPHKQERLMGYRNDAADADTEALEGLGVLPSAGRTRDASNSDSTGTNPSSQSASTGTRGSLIAQFPVYRHPSDGSGPPGGAGGAPAPGAGRRGPGGGGGSPTGQGSPGTMSSADLFYVSPAGPPSGRRTVPVVMPSIGMGRPSEQSPSRTAQSASAATGSTAAPSTDLFDASHRDSASIDTSNTSEPPSLAGKPTLRIQPRISTILEGVGSASDSAEGMPSEAGVVHSKANSGIQQRSPPPSPRAHQAQEPTLTEWLRGFTFLRPFLGSPSGPRAMLPYERAAAPEMQQVEAGLLLPSATPVRRGEAGYRRVTTTAAAYAQEDLADLARAHRPSVASRSTSAAEHDPQHRQRDAASQQPLGESENISDDDEHDDTHEAKSLMSNQESPQEAGPSNPAGLVALKQGVQRRWSGATLGQPIRRVSNISAMSLADLPESIASSIASARSRNKAGAHSRSGSQSRSASLRSHGHSASDAVSRSNSGSAASVLSSKSGSGSGSGSGRRGIGASGGSGHSKDGSGGRRSQRSQRSEGSVHSTLQRVSEIFGEDTDAPAVPAVPTTLAAAR